MKAGLPVTSINNDKFRTMGASKVETACRRHEAAYHYHKAQGNRRLMHMHSSLLMHCATVSVELRMEEASRRSSVARAARMAALA